MVDPKLQAVVDAINTDTNALAATVASVIPLIGTGMSAADVAAVTSTLTAVESRLKATGSSLAAAVPPGPPPAPLPTP